MDMNTSNKKMKIVGQDRHDIFSNMPEDIIGHILSFLHTKDAVRTSVLSKRWKLLWTSITRLSIEGVGLSCMKMEKKQLFIKFLNAVLKNLSSKRIHSFTLSLSIIHRKKYPCDPLPEWISYALNLEVKKLHIKYISNRFYNFSISLFHITSLVHLDLNLSCKFIVPSSNCFKNLKILKLQDIRFIGDSFPYPKEMVLNFPVLELFDCQYIEWVNIKSIIIKAPLLESFSLIFPRCDFDKTLSPTIKIFALHLKSFHYSGMMVEDIILSNPLSIVYASIELRREVQIHLNQDDISQNGVMASKLLKQFQRVKFLKLGLYTIMGLARDKYCVSTLPVFQSLIRLELDLDFSLPSQQVFLDLLHKSPNLEKLGFLSELATLDEDLLMSENLPQCFLSSLKAVKIGFFDWNANNVSLTKYILENTKVLEHLTILMPKGRKRQIRKDLQSSNDLNVASIKVEKTTQLRLISYRSRFYRPN